MPERTDRGELNTDGRWFEREALAARRVDQLGAGCVVVGDESPEYYCGGCAKRGEHHCGMTWQHAGEGQSLDTDTEFTCTCPCCREWRHGLTRGLVEGMQPTPPRPRVSAPPATTNPALEHPHVFDRKHAACLVCGEPVAALQAAAAGTNRPFTQPPTLASGTTAYDLAVALGRVRAAYLELLETSGGMYAKPFDTHPDERTT